MKYGVYLCRLFSFFTEWHKEILGLHANSRQVKHLISCTHTKSCSFLFHVAVSAPQGATGREASSIGVETSAPAHVLPRGRFKSPLPSIHEPKERLLVKNSSAERQKQ